MNIEQKIREILKDMAEDYINRAVLKPAPNRIDLAVKEIIAALQPTEGELEPCSCGWCTMVRLQNLGKQYQELQGICNRLMQDNTELAEKLAAMVKLPSIQRCREITCNLGFVDDIELQEQLAKELHRLLKEG